MITSLFTSSGNISWCTAAACEWIQRNLRAMARGRTVLIIAHRLSAIRQCDRIMTLEKGRIVEVGTHDELLRQGGRYASLHRRQMGVSEGAA